MEAHFRALLNPKTSTTIDAYNNWREKYPTLRPMMDANKLANIRRDIIKNKRLTEIEIQMIKDKVLDEPSTGDQNQQENAATQSIATDEHHEDNEPNQPDLPNTMQTNDAKVAEMEETILRILETVKETDIDKRPSIPKIKHNRHAKSTLATANRALANIKNRRQ